MIVTCPNCSTRFNLPDEQSRPGAKLRCSVCKNVFTLPDEESLDLDAIGGADGDMNLDFGEVGEVAPKSKKKAKKRWPMVVMLLLVLLGGGFAGVWFYAPQLLNAIPGLGALLKPTPTETAPAEDLISRISVADVRQYPVNNEKIGSVTVIEAKAVNGFNVPRELIKVEVALYDKNGRMLVSKQQLAGNAVSLFQLQVLGEQELEQALSNKLGVLTYNTNVPPGGEVPFMVVFYNPPEDAVEYGIKVIEARNPPEQK